MSWRRIEISKNSLKVLVIVLGGTGSVLTGGAVRFCCGAAGIQFVRKEAEAAPLDPLLHLSFCLTGNQSDLLGDGSTDAAAFNSLCSGCDQVDPLLCACVRCC